MKLTELIAFACAVTTGFIAYSMMSPYMGSCRVQYQECLRERYAKVAPGSAQPEVELANVVTVACTVPPGYEIRREDLTLTPWHAGAVPPGAFPRIEDVLQGRST